MWNNNFTDARILNIGAPQGCGLSPLLYTLYTHDCVATHPSTIIGKFADDTVVVGLISKNDETAYREEVEHLTSWCKENNLLLNVTKTKEMVMDLRRSKRTPHLPITINGTPVEVVDSRETVPSQEAEEAHQIPSPTESLLLCHSGVSADQQYNGLVWQLQHHGQKETDPGHKGCRADHPHHSAPPGGHLPQTLQSEGNKNNEGQLSPRTPLVYVAAVWEENEN